jgi:hypothetical protein
MLFNSALDVGAFSVRHFPNFFIVLYIALSCTSVARVFSDQALASSRWYRAGCS